MNNGLICGTCGYKTNKSGNMAVHTNSVHLKIMNFSCKQCNYKTMAKAHLERHVRVVHEKVKDLSCNKCSFKTAYAQHLRKHNRDNHEQENHISKKMAKRIEISKMMEEGIEWHVIRDRLKCSKQLLYKVWGPTYKTEVSGKTVKHRRSKVGPSLIANVKSEDYKVVDYTKEESDNGEETAQQFETNMGDDDYDYDQDNENEESVRGKKCPMCEYIIEDEKTFTKHIISQHMS